MKTILLLLVLSFVGLPAYTQNTSQKSDSPEIVGNHPIRGSHLLWASDAQGHFVVYRPDSLEFIAFDIKYLDKVDAFNRNEKLEAQRNFRDYMYNVGGAVIGGVLALAQDGTERIISPGTPRPNIFIRDDSVGAIIFRYYGDQLEEVQKNEIDFQSRPLPKQLVNLPEDFRYAIRELADSAYLFDAAISVTKQKPVDAR